MDGQIKSKRLCRSTLCERYMLSNCVKHKPYTWWLVIFFFFLLLEMRDLDKLKSKLGIQYRSELSEPKTRVLNEPLTH